MLCLLLVVFVVVMFVVWELVCIVLISLILMLDCMIGMLVLLCGEMFYGLLVCQIEGFWKIVLGGLLELIDDLLKIDLMIDLILWLVWDELLQEVFWVVIGMVVWYNFVFEELIVQCDEVEVICNEVCV